MAMNVKFVARFWRHGVIFGIVFGSLVVLLGRPPFGQDPRYHDFADRRSCLGVPNCLDVVSNAPFLLVGAAGLRLCMRRRFAGALLSWMVFFAGVALVSAGSAAYHWRPSNGTLVWDRLPMTIGFMALFVALLSEFINRKLERVLLGPALLAGFASVLYWHFFDDLRFYVWVQFMPLIVILALLAFFRSRFTHQWPLLGALACYVAAKAFEAFDHEVFRWTQGAIGGHAFKHLLAAAGCGLILEMLRKRTPMEGFSESSGT